MPDHSPNDDSPAPRSPGRRVTPLHLWEAVLRARVELADELASPSGHRHPTARVELVGALEAYVLSLAERGHPVPYTLRDELRLQRLACTNRYDREPVPAKDTYQGAWRSGGRRSPGVGAT